MRITKEEVEQFNQYSTYYKISINRDEGDFMEAILLDNKTLFQMCCFREDWCLELLKIGMPYDVKDRWGNYLFTPNLSMNYEITPKVMQALIDAGLDPNRILDGYSCEHVTLSHGYYQNPSIVNVLKNNGANIRAKDSNGETPLEWALERGNLDTIRELVSIGA